MQRLIPFRFELINFGLHTSGLIFNPALDTANSLIELPNDFIFVLVVVLDLQSLVPDEPIFLLDLLDNMDVILMHIFESEALFG